MRLGISDFIEGRQCFVIVKDKDRPWVGPYRCHQLVLLEGEPGFWVRETSSNYAYIVN